MPPPDAPKQKQYTLKFISGKYQGGEFPIAPGRELVLGRSNELDVVLVEDMVSRKHARIAFTHEALLIEDLGSTNGTFVNGEKVKRARLKEGDRVLIGTSIARVEASDAPAGAGESREAEARAKMQSVASRTTQVKTMSGTIDEVPLVDLLQLFATSKKSGVLAIQHEDGTSGRLYLRKGAVPFASIDELPDIPAQKAIYRMLTWSKGTFELLPHDEREFSEELTLSTEGLLMEGMRHLDETRRLESMLSTTGRYTLASPLVPALKDLDERGLMVLQHAWNHGRLPVILDRSRLTDLDTMEVLAKLVQQRYLKVEG
jgi:hypothetical protein